MMWKVFQSRLGFKETKEDTAKRSLLNAISVENVLVEIGRDKKKTQHTDIYQERAARRFLSDSYSIFKLLRDVKEMNRKCYDNMTCDICLLVSRALKRST